MQDEKEKEFKLKVDEQVTRLAQSCEKAQRRVEQLKQEMASPMQGEVAEGHRARVTALEVSTSLFYVRCCSLSSELQPRCVLSFLRMCVGRSA